jgi:hypothetical protein
MAQTPLLILRFNGPAAAPASPARCNIIVTGTPGAEVMYNGGADSVTKGANYNYTVTTCPPYGTLAGGTVIIKGACSPVLASNTLPTAIHLSTASPNPAATATTVTYDIPADGLVMLELYNVYGTLVRTAVAAMQQQGEYTIQLSLEDLPMGSYILRLETGGMAKSRKIVVWR